MSTSGQTQAVTMFADPEAAIWGIGIGTDTVRWTVAAGGRDAAARSLTAVAADATEHSLTMPEPVKLLELGRVTGTVAVAGRELSVDAPAISCAPLRTAKLASVRLVGAWFPDRRVLAVAAVRPSAATGHDRDAIEVIGAGLTPMYVVDPRLSVTYEPDGRPRRVGLELWVSDDAEGEQHSLRVHGQCDGAALNAVENGVAPATDGHTRPLLSAYPLSCSSAGRRGRGIHALIALG